MKLVQKISIAYIRTRLFILSAFAKRKAAAEAFELFCTPMKQPRIPLSPLFLEAEPLSLTIEGI
ncbi:MAG TPA: hypothetical protein VLD19_10050, partial [Chitinophagaceae bacterium]|nr:hypothetical protein [Chitinophagaceae bacterium]